MRPYIVYQTKDGKFGYRSMSNRLGATYVAENIVARGEAVQTWSIDAYDGADAISRIKKILKAKGLK